MLAVVQACRVAGGVFTAVVSILVPGCVEYLVERNGPDLEEQDAGTALETGDIVALETGDSTEPEGDTGCTGDCDEEDTDDNATVSDCLVGQWHLDGDATDTSGNGNDGNVTGAIPTSDPAGNADAAYAFDGENDYVGIPDSASLGQIELNQELTIAAWCRVDAWYNDWDIFAVVEKYLQTEDTGWELVFAAKPFPQLRFAADKTHAAALAVAWSPDFGTWHHIAATYSHGDVSLYIDGVLEAAGTTSKPLVGTDGGPFHIGTSWSGADEYSNGAIDEVEVYSCALTGDDVVALYSH